MTTISEIQRTRFYIYQKQKNVKCFNTKSQTLCKKQDNLRYIFYIQKTRHFTLQDFS